MMKRKDPNVFRILHSADWHLGKTLNELSREEEHKLFLDWLLKQVKENGVDVVLVAGDVFDTANPPKSAEKLYFNFVADLFKQTETCLVLVAGNHDSVTQLEAPKQVLQSVRTYVQGVVSENPSERLLLLPDDENPKVAIALVPFLREKDLRLGRLGESQQEVRTAISEGITRIYLETAGAVKERKIGVPVIATGHLTVTGSSTSESERDIHIGGLGDVSSSVFPQEFAYVALGHLHRPQATENGRVRYSGSPIPLSFSEANDQKEVRIIDVTNEGVVQNAIEIPVFRKLTQLRTDFRDLESKFETLATDNAGELKTWVEVVLTDHNGLVDANTEVRRLAQKYSFDILKVMLEGTSNRSSESFEQLSNQDVEDMLGNPNIVFERVLNQNDVSEEEREGLRLAYQQILEQVQQSL
jgi:exonuclease SbcD